MKNVQPGGNLGSHTNGMRVAVVTAVSLALALCGAPQAVEAQVEPDWVWVTPALEFGAEIPGRDSIDAEEPLVGQVSYWTELHNWADWGGTSGEVLQPRLSLVTGLPVAEGAWNDELDYLIAGSEYEWAFPDIPNGGDGFLPGVVFESSVTAPYTPGFSLTRSVEPAVVTYPGGLQTATIYFTPERGEFEGAPLGGSSVIVMLQGDADYSPLIVSATSRDPAQPVGFVTDSWVYWPISSPAVGTTYVLDIEFEVELEDGVTSILLKPMVYGKNRYSGEDPGQVIGNSLTTSTDYGTWTWQTASQHTWLFTRTMDLAASLSQESLAIRDEPPVEPDWVWVVPSLEFDTELSGRDSIDPEEQLVGRVSYWTSIQNWADWRGTSGEVLQPRSSLLTTLPVDGVWDENYLIAGSEYEWAFPDIPNGGDGFSPGVEFESTVMAPYSPGFSLTRSVEPAVLDYPGGLQTVTVYFTPERGLFEGAPLDISNVFVTVEGDADFSPQIVSAASRDPAQPVDFFNDSFVYWSIFSPVVGTTYVLDVELEVELEGGVTSLALKPSVSGRNWHSVDEEQVVGNSLITSTDYGTWTWQTASEHTWGFRQTTMFRAGLSEEVLATHNEPPVAVCDDDVVVAGPTCTANASIDGGSYDPDGYPLVLSQDPTAPYGLGETLVTLLAEDEAGATDSCTATVAVVDETPPEITCPVGIVLVPDAACQAQVPDLVSQVVTADNCSGVYDISLVQSVTAGQSLGVGTHVVTVTGTDAEGNSASCQTVLDVHFDFDGFLPPLGGADATGGSYGDPLRTFKRNSTIPLKFQIGCSGTPHLEGSHTLQMVKWTSDTDAEAPIDATPQDTATTGNAFRLTGEQWHYNLDAQSAGMSAGQWELIAALSDGTQHRAWIQVK